MKYRVVFSLLITLTVAGCCSSSTTIEGQHPVLAADEEGAEQGEERGIRDRFLDAADAGNDPFTPGCHLKFTTPCTGPGEYFAGDSCIDGQKLSEWTNGVCHRLIDKAVWNCRNLCIQRGFPNGGQCAVATVACPGVPGRQRSAKCECFPN